jgi:putative radical SAM enzyme (TIGR03279 family)
VKAGERLVSINGHRVRDVLDYMFYAAETRIALVIENAGTERELRIEKDEYDDIGLEFESFLMDKKQSCRNKCVFCFIDQLPPGMRETLYFKDDDARLSFLQGNYVTLTNMTQEDVDRIIEMRLGINVSVHTTNPELRCKMMQNRFAGEKLDFLWQMARAGIQLNCQIVLCPGLNDGAELERTLTDLGSMLPHLTSVAIVPLGVTKYRQGLYPLTTFTPETAADALDIIGRYQAQFMEKHGTRAVFPSDEFFLLAGREIPDAAYYEEYPQYENGVGMLRLLDEEGREEMEHYAGDDRKRHVTIATGRLAADWMRQMCRIITEKFPNVTADVIPIRNDFFGEMITVSGLITGTDLIAQLKGRDLGDAVLIPCNMLRSGENVFLDDITVEQVILELKTSVEVVDREGKDLCLAVLGNKSEECNILRAAGHGMSPGNKTAGMEALRLGNVC